MDITRRFNQFLILLFLTFLISCIRIGIAFANDCYYGNEFKNNLSDLAEMSQFAKKAEFVRPYVEFQYNGYSVSKKEYERLKLRDMDKDGDPNLRMP